MPETKVEYSSIKFKIMRNDNVIVMAPVDNINKYPLFVNNSNIQAIHIRC